MNIKRV